MQQPSKKPPKDSTCLRMRVMAMDSVKKKFLQCTPTSAFSSQRGGENGPPLLFSTVHGDKRRQKAAVHEAPC